MTDELVRRLMAAGLTKQQANSVTAETLVNLFMNDDGKTLIAEAKRQVAEMSKTVRLLTKDYEELKAKIDSIAGTLTTINEAQEQYGSVTDEKAKNIIALYAALLSMNRKAGSSGPDSVINAGYILYAYLGGQAKREISYND